MQEVYRIQVTACYKPWRYNRTMFITDKSLFDFISDNEESMDDGIDWSIFLKSNPDIAEKILTSEYTEMTKTVDEETGEVFYEDACIHEIMGLFSVSIGLPYICLGEAELYSA